MVATERMLRRLDAGERLLRVDIAVRAAAAVLADGEQRIVVVRCAPDGAVEIHLTAPASLATPWTGADRCGGCRAMCRWKLSRPLLGQSALHALR